MPFSGKWTFCTNLQIFYIQTAANGGRKLQLRYSTALECVAGKTKKHLTDRSGVFVLSLTCLEVAGVFADCNGIAFALYQFR